MSEIDWSTNAVKVLMAQYERRPELWNRRHSLYRAPTAKCKAWLALAKIFSCDVAELRKKFNSLLASYRRERSKIKDGGRSHWFLYPQMSFLPGYLRNPPPHHHHLSNQLKEEALEEPYESPAEERGGRYETDSEPEPEPGGGGGGGGEAHQAPRAALQEPPGARDRRARTLKRGQLVTKAFLERRLREAGAGRAAGAGGDHCHSYGEYIAATLRRHDNKTQCLIKQAINNILFEQEMHRYSSPQEPDMLADMLDDDDD